MLLEESIFEYADKSKWKLSLSQTWGECKKLDDSLTPRAGYIYFFVGNDQDDWRPIYIGSSKKGIKRVKQHATMQGCVTLKNVLECSCPHSDDFMVHIFSCEFVGIIRHLEYRTQRFFCPWIYTPVGSETFVRILRFDDFKIGRRYPAYIQAYREQKKSNPRLSIDEGHRAYLKYKREDKLMEERAKSWKEKSANKGDSDAREAIEFMNYLSLIDNK